ncbi:MAG: nuclear transport factor 2 family protein [Pseudomonadota bacterium]
MGVKIAMGMIIGTILLVSGVSAENSGIGQDETAIRKAVDTYVEAYKRGDAPAAAAQWSRQGRYLTQAGEYVKGPEKIRPALEKFFSENKGIQVKAAVFDVELSSGDRAIAKGFAVTREQATDSNALLQLAVDKNGLIAGTYYNTATDIGRPVRGMVDKKTQRAAWTFSDGKDTDIIMETGLFNLTQDQTDALVHFGKDKTQKWRMVRLNEPKDTESAREGQK